MEDLCFVLGFSEVESKTGALSEVNRKVKTKDPATSRLITKPANQRPKKPAPKKGELFKGFSRHRQLMKHVGYFAQRNQLLFPPKLNEVLMKETSSQIKPTTE